MTTEEVLQEVLSGKRMSKQYKGLVMRVLKSIGNMYHEFPTKRVEVNKWLASFEGYEDTTVRTWFRVLRSVCKYMEENYDLPNPCKGVETPTVLSKRRRYFTPDEIARILQACSSEYELALVSSLIDSTCRIGEIASLKVKDVGDEWIDVKGKTGEKRYRLDNRICEVLKRMGGESDDLVFKNNGHALTMRIIRICKRAGISGKKLGPHTLRHSSASLVASETKNVMAVKALLQHDDVQTSMIYIHDVESELQKGISPLQLFSDRLSSESKFKQLPMSASSDGQGSEVEVIDVDDGVDDLLMEMFPEVGEGIKIRPLLTTKDLRLIRSGFLSLANDGKYNKDVGMARELMKRMLRKAY